ncbi:hypothetical protein V6N13_033413 [Hibiscus sabdariffa]|uniref:Uncharacterized protein n=1 Tax=Hibiscus sabdariffa TaxID=183260 RepID=A0ABR2FAG8_9ROSI
MNHRSSDDEPSPVIGEVVGTITRYSRMEVEAEQLPLRIYDMVENDGPTQGYPAEDSHVSSSHENEPVAEAQNEWCQIGVAGAIEENVAPRG